ncbi:MAG: folate-binding protein, partial [Gemmatimonadetes bacterium]|nr:folate-binding protein [Gemmatimonadota bacterium]
GWPGLGTEIDAKTLPQEVRYDAIDGVSYTKGCYTGQETVARLHFRGHTNRALRGLIWDHAPNPSESAIIQNDKPVGRVTSIAWLAPFEQYIGLGMVHRSAATEQPVRAADAPAGIVDLPFRFDP